MDKNTLSNYGWIVIAVLVLSVMIALATPFGEYIKAGVESTTAGLFETQQNALEEGLKGFNTTTKIYCWGDSITESTDISWTKYFSDLMNSKTKTIPYKAVSVVNCGVGGETTKQIATRQGGHQLYVKEFTIPETGDVTITFTENIALMYNGSTGIFNPNTSNLQINPVTINGVKGTLSRQSKDNYNYTFTRSEQGESVYVASGTPLYTNSSQKSANDINIIFTGTNDSNVNNIVKYQEEIINSLPNDKYIVIGLVSDGRFTADELNNINDTLSQKWGKHFLDAKTLLSSMNTDEMLLNTTEFKLNTGDTERMASGLLPSAYMYDDLVHLNKFGGMSLAGFVYRKGIELGYWDSVPTKQNADNYSTSNFEYSITEFDSVYGYSGGEIFGKAVITGVKDSSKLNDVTLYSYLIKDNKTYIVESVNESAWSVMKEHTQKLTLYANMTDASHFPICLTGKRTGTAGGNLATSDSAFKGFMQLKTITLGNNVLNVPTAMFVGCTTLEEFNFPEKGFLTTFLGSTFRYCTNLKTVNFIPKSVTRMNATFNGCKKLTGTLIFKTQNVTFENGGFEKSISNITFKAPANSVTYTNIEKMISNFTGENIILAKS